MFYSDYNQLASKSVDVNALTFRGNKNKNQNDNNNSNNKDQKDNRNDKLEKN